MQYKEARLIALKIYKALLPYCSKLDLAGSMRREKPEVHDIEFCCVPRITEVKNLFQEVQGIVRVPGFVQTVLSLGDLKKGDVKTGRMVQIALKEGIVLDLFMPQEHDYYRQLAIRTGHKDYSHKVLANAWLKKGWAGTDDGLRLQTESYQIVVGRDENGKEKKKWKCDRKEPTLPPVFENELQFFNFIGLSWVEPSKRYV